MHQPLPPRLERFREAYLLMAKEAHYRPMAPGDGLGRIELTKKELADPDRLDKEATAYALAFSREEDEQKFRVGCSIFETNRALVWTIEAARLLAGGGNTRALALLKMVAKEVEKAGRGIAEIL